MIERILNERIENIKEMISIEREEIKYLEDSTKTALYSELNEITMSLMVAYKTLSYLQDEYIEVLKQFKPKKEIPLRKNFDDLLNELELDFEEPVEEPEFIKKDIENEKEGELKKWIQ